MNYAYETIKAIKNRINDNSKESNDLKNETNSITFGTASADNNYITYHIITSNLEQTFTSYIENSLIQFSIFAANQTKCLEIMSKLESVFDDAELEFDNYRQIECTRANSNFVERFGNTGLYHYYVEYDINVTKNKE